MSARGHLETHGGYLAQLLSTEGEDIASRKVVIGIGPGETTGLCVVYLSIEGLHYIVDQLPSPPSSQQKALAFTAGVQGILEWIEDLKGISVKLCWDHIYMDSKDKGHIVIEDYRIYSWKSEQHVWSNIHTLRLIGALQYSVERLIKSSRPYSTNITFSLQGAQQGKAFFKDPILRELGVWDQTKGLPHGRDAFRHAMHHLCFNM